MPRLPVWTPTDIIRAQSQIRSGCGAPSCCRSLTWVNKPREAFRLTAVIATAAFSLLATGVFALPTEPPKVQTVNELKAAVANIVDKDHVPGVGIAVVSKDKVI